MDHLFEVHKLSPEGLKKAEALSVEFDQLAGTMEALIGASPSREKALARTKLEESCFYAKKALAMNPANQA